MTIALVLAATMKTWWFFGQTETTEAGITADAEALQRVGFDGVVYYDQVHGPSPKADKLWSEDWWMHLDFAAAEAARLGLSFEINVGNGYVAGGKEIPGKAAMKRLGWTERFVSGGREVEITLGRPATRGDYYQDVAVFALPVEENPAELEIKECDQAVDVGKSVTLRHVTYETTAEGKNLNGAMQRPRGEKDPADAPFGYGFEVKPEWGVLEASEDGQNWREVVSLKPVYRAQGGASANSAAFAPITARYWRVRKLVKGAELKSLKLTSAAKMPDISARNGETSDVLLAPVKENFKGVPRSGVVKLTDKMAPDGKVRWNAPRGRWRILRFATVQSGAKTKHGRPEALGYECDKLAKVGADTQWETYTKRIISHLKEKKLPLAGVAIDSHEAGAQNWTESFLEEFKTRRGYDLLPLLPVMAGYVIDDAETTDLILRDVRLTISEMIAENYYGEFDRLSRAEGLTLTAQAIGGALCTVGDSILAKKYVEKPQGEFWAYQREGAYDIKDCSSAAHLFGKRVAAAEALTDVSYKQGIPELKRLVDLAVSFGANEFTVCATPHIPEVNAAQKTIVGGREYGVNRTNPWWNESEKFWRYNAKIAALMQEGVPQVDVLVFMGDELPVKILGHRIPEIPEGLDWDAATGATIDRLEVKVNTQGETVLATPEGIEYRAVALAHGAYVGPKSTAKLAEWKKRGVSFDSSLLTPTVVLKGGLKRKGVVFAHRRIGATERYFLANTERWDVKGDFEFPRVRGQVTARDIWNDVERDSLDLKPGDSMIVEIRK